MQLTMLVAFLCKTINTSGPAKDPRQKICAQYEGICKVNPHAGPMMNPWIDHPEGESSGRVLLCCKVRSSKPVLGRAAITPSVIEQCVLGTL
jgi:hypothetical protein